MALMTTLGLLSLENNLFDEMQVPEQIDKEVLTDYILSKVGNLEVFYTDASFMKKAIGFWSKARLNT